MVLLLSGLIPKNSEGSVCLIQFILVMVKTIPEDIIKGLIASFVILLIIKLVNKVKFLNFKLQYEIEQYPNLQFY